MNKDEGCEALNAIRDDLLVDSALPLYEYRTENKYFPVLGEGNSLAKIVFIGEAPGKNEAKTGRPFCGSAGKILDGLLEHVGIKREEIYITNIVNDRPPKNRDPKPDEIEMYCRYLDRVLDTIKPKVIATLGRFSMEYILIKFGQQAVVESISVAHGKSYKAQAPWGKISIIPLYHPAAAIYNQKLKDTLKKDFEILRKFVKTK